jgi:hypothetical protein
VCVLAVMVEGRPRDRYLPLYSAPLRGVCLVNAYDASGASHVSDEVLRLTPTVIDFRVYLSSWNMRWPRRWEAKGPSADRSGRPGVLLHRPARSSATNAAWPFLNTSAYNGGLTAGAAVLHRVRLGLLHRLPQAPEPAGRAASVASTAFRRELDDPWRAFQSTAHTSAHVPLFSDAAGDNDEYE